MIHNVTSWQNGLYRIKAEAKAPDGVDQKSDGYWFEAPALAKCYEPSKYLPEVFAWRRPRTDDLQVISVSYWSID